MDISLIGFGEAGSTFALHGRWAHSAIAFDRKTRAADEVALAMRAAMAQQKIQCANNLKEAVRTGAPILSLVTADQALSVALKAARHMRAGQVYLDMNSVAPTTKCQAAKAIEAADGHYVDVAIMAPVIPAHLSVPLLLSGSKGGAAQQILEELGFQNIRTVGTSVGRASTVKMLRSILYKGLEALTAECFMAADAAGVTDEILLHLPKDWAAQADYRLDRMLVHGTRRGAEMREVVKTLSALGVSASLSRAAGAYQNELGARGLTPPPEGLAAKLDHLAKARRR